MALERYFVQRDDGPFIPKMYVSIFKSMVELFIAGKKNYNQIEAAIEEHLSRYNNEIYTFPGLTPNDKKDLLSELNYVGSASSKGDKRSRSAVDHEMIVLAEAGIFYKTRQELQNALQWSDLD